jgi:ribonuclease G
VKNNLEAVKEVVRQLRLRDIGGIIVIDFIDMSNPKNRETVEDALRSELERDRTKTYVVEISPLGLVEMTRQNVTDGPREILTRRCPVCEGDGFVVSDETNAIEVERKLRALAAGSRVQAFRVAVHPRVLSLLAGPGGSRLAAIEAASKRRFFFVAAENGHVHLDHFEVLEQGKLETLRPESPLQDGQSIDLKLVEVGLYDVGAGVAKVDGVDVIVANAAKLVGKKVHATVGCVLEGMAFATLADTEDVVAGITFEAEAEKPTRAPSRKKPPVADDAGRPGTTESPIPEEEEELEEEELEAAEEPAEATAAGGGPPKKRTRRGTRGGRGRSKAKATATAGAAEPETQEAASAKATPKIHVPPAELGTPEEEVAADAAGDGAASEAEAAKKKTRRGTRGGRKRKKPSSNGMQQDSAGRDNGSPEDAPETYVPMSEWIDDFDSRPGS